MSASIVMCCIDGCSEFGVTLYKGRLYCQPHLKEEQANCESCSGCDIVPFKCCVKGCDGEGVITQMKTQNHYCIAHAWKADRPDEAGLRHPQQAQWNPEDALRAHGEGIAVDKEKFQPVSQDVYEQCMRELEEAKKKGYKL